MRIRPITLALPTVFAVLVFSVTAVGPADASYSYSAYQCPMYGGYGGGGYGGGGYGGGGYGGGGYGGGGYPGYGRMCGAPSIFHYYVCCDYNPMDCCVVLETWVIVMLVLVGILGLACCLACCGACVWGYQRSRGDN